MTRTSIFILGLVAATAFPVAASAQCGTMQGSFILTCEQGVQVYRHNSLSGIPAPMTQAQATVKAAEIRAKTARQQIAAQNRTNARNAELRERELATQEFQARTIGEALRRDPNAFGFNNNRIVSGGDFGRVRFNGRKRGPKSRFNENY